MLPGTIKMLIPISRIKYCIDYYVCCIGYNTDSNDYNIYVPDTTCIVLDTICMVSCTIFYSHVEYITIFVS